MIDPLHELPDSFHFRRIALGFGFSAAGLALLCLDSVLELGYILSFAPELRKLLLHPLWRLGVGGTITSLTFLGSYLLWRRIGSLSWSRASTLLVLMNLVHLGLWLVEHHGEIGLPDQRLEHGWLRLQFSQVMNWAEFLCWVGMVRELNRLASFMTEPDVRARRFPSFSGFCVIGLVVALGVAGGLTDWAGGWPLQRAPWLGPLDSLMLATLTTMIMFAASLQLTLYCLKSVPLALIMSRYVSHFGEPEQIWTHDHWDDDPWGNRASAGEFPT